MRALLSALTTVFLVLLTASAGRAQAPFSPIFDFDLGYWAGAAPATATVQIADDVVDGCWTNTASPRNKVLLEFQRSGYEIVEYLGTLRITLSAVGHSNTPSNCAVSTLFIAQVFTIECFPDDAGNRLCSSFYRVLFLDQSLLTGPRSTMSARVSEALADAAVRFLVQLELKRHEFVDALREQLPREDADYWQDFLGAP